METTVNTSNFEQFYRTLFPRLVQFAMAYTENEAEASAYRTASHDTQSKSKSDTGFNSTYRRAIHHIQQYVVI